MRSASLIILLLVCIPANYIAGQVDSLRLSGQLSSWINYSHANKTPLSGGLRYIPQLNAGVSDKRGKLFDAEVSMNIYGNVFMNPFDSVFSSGRIKPYRAWIRYSSDQFEFRLGLQKLNFGSASMLRPLMWFDQIDPRDPLQLTDGVWGLLGRYYFMNNANIWIWGLYGNKSARGWDIVPSNRKIPEVGGRFQLPVPSGEIAFTYHHRVADSRLAGIPVIGFEKIGENKYGFDLKLDLVAGLWLEGSFTHKNRNIGLLTNQVALNAGADYTFSIGNGLYAGYEQLILSFDEKPFAFSDNVSFSVLNLNYPVSMIDRAGAMFYYDWSGKNLYAFLNWQRQFDKIMFYIMAYWNPSSFNLPAQTSSQNIFAGKGIQLMFVFNH